MSSSTPSDSPSSEFYSGRGAPNFDPALTRALGLNVAEWTDASVRCMGIPTHRTDALWWREPGGSGIYLAAVILDAATTDDQLQAQMRPILEIWKTHTFVLYDIWASRDLTPLGLVKQWQEPWYVRPPGLGAPAARAQPTDLHIELVQTAAELLEFEIATRIGFEHPTPPPYAPFSQHAESTLAEPDMLYLIGRVQAAGHEGPGAVVSSVITHQTGEMVGIYGLSTVPAYRRRGYARALVRSVATRYPDLALCVQPDPDTIPIYTEIGFVPGGEIAFWQADPAA